MCGVTLLRKSALEDLIAPIWDIPRYCALLFIRYRASPWMTCPWWSQGHDFRTNRNKHPLWIKVVVSFLNTKVGQHFIYTASQMNLYRPVLTLLLLIAAACEVKLPHVCPCFLQFTLQYNCSEDVAHVKDQRRLYQGFYLPGLPRAWDFPWKWFSKGKHHFLYCRK